MFIQNTFFFHAVYCYLYNDVYQMLPFSFIQVLYCKLFWKAI